jgi:acyl carrier protein
MTEQEVYERLNVIFNDLFDRDDIVLSRETSQADIDGWDSKRMIDIVLAIESRLGVRLTTAEAEKIETAGDIAALIGQRLASPP